MVLKTQDDDTIRELYQWMKAHLAEPKMPGRWWLVQEIPRTSRGKINRDNVRDACLGQDALDLGRILAGGDKP